MNIMLEFRLQIGDNIMKDKIMETSLLGEGLKFLILGMTTVYLFLYLMVIILKLESKIIKKYFSKNNQTSLSLSNKHINNNDEIIAVITAVITEYRKK